MTFDEIINTISEQEMIRLVESGRPVSKEARQTHIMSAEEQRLNLAFYAKAAREHVGWDGFSEQNRQSFMQNIEQLYASISAPCPQNRFIDNLFAHTGQYIEDRHFSVNNIITVARPNRNVPSDATLPSSKINLSATNVSAVNINKTMLGKIYSMKTVHAARYGKSAQCRLRPAKIFWLSLFLTLITAPTLTKTGSNSSKSLTKFTSITNKNGNKAG